ncbi:MAG: hypothetical protein ACRCZ8_14675 [Aeromonas sobria]
MHVAEQMVAKYGNPLVGKTVMTFPMGLWPGGAATITELNPDPNAPEIVFNVKHSTTGEEIGVFYDELLIIEE